MSYNISLNITSLNITSLNMTAVYIKGKILKDLSELDFKALYVFIFIISLDKLLIWIDKL